MAICCFSDAQTIMHNSTLPPRCSCKIRVLLVSVLFALTSPALWAQQADFTADLTSGCAPLTVRFTDASTGTVATWDWEFGNGNSSTEKNPSAIFTLPGVYTVKLTVTGAGQDTETKTGYIVVHKRPTVNFSFDKTEGCSPLQVKFKDASVAGSGNITEWYWVFGDGGTSTQTNPTYIYQTSGTKTISLKIKNQYGCEQTAVGPTAIKVLGPAADFKVSSAVFCQVPALAQYTNLSTGDAPLTYTWTFGDGNSSTQKDPSNNYTGKGLFTTTLTTTDKNGCTSKKTRDIRTGGEGGLTATASKTKICIGESVSFSATAETTVLSYNWNFGDSTSSSDASPQPLIYKRPGTYTVVLNAQLLGKACESVVSFPIEVLAYPVPDFSYSVDCNQKVTFTSTSTNTSRVYWEMLDNGATSTQTSFSRTYPGTGIYTVRLTAYNSLNCSKTIERTINVNGKPVASFLPDKQQDCSALSLSGCAPFTLNFTNTSTSQTSFTSKWTFGDGGTSTSKSPVHTYAAGKFTVTLEIKNAQGCTAKTTAQVLVSDIKPVAKFSIPKNSVCALENVTFTDQSTNANFWCWDFGDGSTSSAQSPTHNYEKPGVYTVTLIAKNGGCTSSFTIPNAITVKDPYVNFEITKGCANPYEIYLVNKSTNYTSLSWSFGDGHTATGNTGSHLYTGTGNYSVVLTGTNSTTQCSVKVTKPVSIYDVEADFEVDNLTPCIGAPVTFKDKSANATGWTWTFGDGSVPDPRKNPVATYNQAGHFTATLYARDPDGCADTKSISIDVLDIKGNFNTVGTSDCSTLDVKFTDLSTATPPVTGWKWDFGDNSPIATISNPQHVYTSTGLYPVTLTLTNGNGTCTFIKYGAVKFTVPEARFDVTKRGNCMDEYIQFYNSSGDASAFTWDFGNGQTSQLPNPRIAYDTTGEYTVTLKAKDLYGCERSVTKPQFISITKPEAKFSATEIHSECPPLTTSFHDESLGVIAKWNWNFGDGQASAYASPASTYIRPGEFDVTLTVTDANGCQDTITQPKLVFVGGPYGTFGIQGPGPFCINDSTFFTAHTTNAVTHRWDFGDGIVRDQVEMDAGHHYKGTGLYNVALVLFDAKGCQVVADGEAKVEIMDTTKIDFKYPACVFTGVESLFEAAAEQDGMTYTWTADGMPLGTGSPLPVILDVPGHHHVTLHAVNPTGCTSMIDHDVPVQGDVLLVPNVFTPNGLDDLNSTFEIVGIERSTWNLTVYNRWGKEVYEQRAYKNNWTAHGLSTGVYYYLLKNAICPGREYKGVVSIAR